MDWAELSNNKTRITWSSYKEYLCVTSNTMKIPIPSTKDGDKARFRNVIYAYNFIFIQAMDNVQILQ